MKNLPIGLITLAVASAATSPVLGATGGGEAHSARGLGEELLTLGFFAINFCLFLFVLRRYALGFVKRKLVERRESIVTALEEARQARAEAEALRQEYEAKLASLAAEQERLRSRAIEGAERESRRALEEARAMAERIRAEARSMAQREVLEARRQLRRDIAEQAVRIASGLLRNNITESDHHRFVRQFVVEVNDAGISSR